MASCIDAVGVVRVRGGRRRSLDGSGIEAEVELWVLVVVVVQDSNYFVVEVAVMGIAAVGSRSVVADSTAAAVEFAMDEMEL